jgi:hypothetical protein
MFKESRNQASSDVFFARGKTSVGADLLCVCQSGVCFADLLEDFAHFRTCFKCDFVRLSLYVHACMMYVCMCVCARMRVYVFLCMYV